MHGLLTCKDADLVILGGLASYFAIDVLRDKIIRPIYMALKPGGAFFFDLQLECPYYRRSVRIFDWPNMELAANATIAISTIEAMRRVLWLDGLKFSADYQLDTYNEFPTSVMVTMAKL